nr:transposon Ty3-I Gag-Pol polyprotein [Tanacetum cinerariifolium]
MPPRMRTKSAGWPAVESLGRGTDVRVGRGGRGKRPREGNDERVDDLNGQGNDQGIGVNGGAKGVNGNENVKNVLVNGNRVGCSYKEFLACNPKEYDGCDRLIMPSRMRARSAGWPTVKSLGRGTGVRVGRGKRGRRPREEFVLVMRYKSWNQSCGITSWPGWPCYIKIEHQGASGLLQPLDISVWKWDEISMDFVTGLPRTQKKNDVIWVVVDLLTKLAYFFPIRKDFSISILADIFQQEIVRLHGTPAAILSDRDPRYTSCFWKGLQNAWGLDSSLVR